VAELPGAPRIAVLAGTNGAGKSSIGGTMLSEKGTRYFNPDQATLQLLEAKAKLSLAEANGLAWNEGKRLLERAISERLDFNFETTLGGRTIANLLHAALAAGIEVRIWYAGLSSPELHIARVLARVAKGGHDIPEAKIRERYIQSRANLISLLPKLTELWVYDNSDEADPDAGIAPRPKLILHMRSGQIVASCDASKAPEWTRPILAAAALV
jgi:predicted ABC-type ATPase